MIPKIIHAIWIGPKQLGPTYEKSLLISIETAIASGWEFRIHTSEESEDYIRDWVTSHYNSELVSVLNIKNSIGTSFSELMLEYSRYTRMKYLGKMITRYAFFSDIIRLKLLIKYGGIYQDADIVTLGDVLHRVEKLDEEKLHCNYESSVMVCGSILIAKPNLPILNEMVNFVESKSYNNSWGAIGPHLVTDLSGYKTNSLNDEFGVLYPDDVLGNLDLDYTRSIISYAINSGKDEDWIRNKIMEDSNSTGGFFVMWGSNGLMEIEEEPNKVKRYYAGSITRSKKRLGLIK